MTRYSARPFPSYRFVPGRSPHPRVDPAGHSYGQPDWHPEPVSAESWAASEAWLYGVDLFNYGYWWEAHEVLEGLWHAAGRTTPDARFLQGLIQVAAGCLKREMGEERGARRLLAAGLEKLEPAPDRRFGVDVPALVGAVRRFAAGESPQPPGIALEPW